MEKVVRRLGGELLLPRTDPVRIRRYFGHAKGFPDSHMLTEIAKDGAPAWEKSAPSQLTRPIAYGNQRNMWTHEDLVWDIVEI